MGLVYLPTFAIKNQPNVGKYTSPMDPMGKCLLSLQLCGFQDLCKRGIFLNRQVLIWYKAAGAAFHILCSSLNGMSCSNVCQVHQKQKSHKYIFIKFMTCDMVCNKAKTITHTFFLLFKGKKPTLGFVGPPFSPQVTHGKNHSPKIASRPRKKKLHSCHLR